MATAAPEQTQDITLKCSSEYEEYTYTESHDIWTLVSLTAPCQNENEDGEKEDKVPMDIVAVMDKSGSMAGEKLELVKKTMEFVLTQLNDKDRLALITYDTEIYTDFDLMNMTKENKKKASDKIQNIMDGSSTNLCGGLMRGLCEIIRRPAGRRNDVASVLLFTDGLANHGITHVDGIIEAMKNPERHCKMPPPSHRDNPGQAAPHTSWLKNIFGSKGTPAKPSTPARPASVKKKSDKSPASDAATVYTFGFGSDHDADMLKKISDAGNGMYYFVETEEKIGESFAHCLGGLASTVAQGIQLSVNVEKGVTIKEVHTTRAFEHTDAGKSVKVNIGDLQAEESRDIVLEVSIDTMGAEAPDIAYLEQNVLNVSVDYFNVNSGKLETAVGSLAVKRATSATVHDDTTVNAVVEKEKHRVDVTKAIKAAGDCARRGSWSGTQTVLNARLGSLRRCKETSKQSNNYDPTIEDEYDAMIDDLEDYCSNTRNAQEWQRKGVTQEMNIGQAYGCQRSNLPESKAFQSKSKVKAVKKFQMF